MPWIRVIPSVSDVHNTGQIEPDILQRWKARVNIAQRNNFSSIFRRRVAFTIAPMSGGSVSEFMDRRAVDLRTGGRYSFANWYDHHGNRREFACRTSRISPYQMLVEAPVIGPVGDRVISFFGEFGKIDGWVTDVSGPRFLIEIAVTRHVRERLAAKLAWLEKKQKDSVVEARAMRRLIPDNPHTNLIFADGSTLSCFVIDVSPSGVAVSADAEPEVGTRLAVGRAVGHVIRRFNEGFAVKFDRLIEPAFLEENIRPPSDIAAYGVTRRNTASAAQSSAAVVPLNVCKLTGSVATLPEEQIWLLD